MEKQRQKIAPESVAAQWQQIENLPGKCVQRISRRVLYAQRVLSGDGFGTVVSVKGRGNPCKQERRYQQDKDKA